MRNFIRIGKIISTHGIKGEVKVFPTTDDVKRFDKLDDFYIVNDDDADDSKFENLKIQKKESIKYIKNTCILKIIGYNSIEDSLKLINQNIYVDRKNAVTLNKNEYFVIDLIGLDAYKDNVKLGKVVDVLKTKANSILVINYNDKELLVPFVEDFVDDIDINNSKLQIKTIEGLI